MDKLAYVPARTLTAQDAAGQPVAPTVKQRPALVPDPLAEVREDVAQIGAARVRRLVADLPKLQRLVVTWLFGLEGLTLTRREIAARLRLSPAAVRRLEAEALQVLRDVMLAPRRAA
jgi:DNA-directed RNA polymerase specialized sigma subunit